MEGREFSSGISGVIFDYSIIFNHYDNDYDVDVDEDNISPMFLSLLRKLRYSSINTAISYVPDLSSSKVNFLQRIGSVYSVDCNPIDNNNNIARSTLENGLVLYVLSHHNKDHYLRFQLPSSRLIVLAAANECQDSNFIRIDQLSELPLTISRLIRNGIGIDDIVTVGYMMKSSREEDFVKRGAFPLNPTLNGLAFLPLEFDLPLPLQLQHIDVILHKATDEIASVDLRGSSEFPNSVTYTARMQELKRFMDCDLDLCVIDPLDKIYPVLDRLKIQQILLELEDFKVSSSHIIRGPHFLEVEDYNEPDLVQRLSEAKLCLPSIVKPRVSCGVAEAHTMAIVFKVEDFKDLHVPLPAIIQEYVNHSSTLFKFYVLGEKVFYAVKKSTPNADTLMKLSGGPELKPLAFNSLKSLPTGNGNSLKGNSETVINHGLVNEAAMWLLRKLGLTIFGFDVVVEEGTGDHVIVDVNYLPSFKEVPNIVAMPAFWDAIKNKFESHRTKTNKLRRGGYSMASF